MSALRLLLVLLACHLPGRAERPNIILITTDDQRADALGSASNGFYHSPVLDALAARSLVFTDAHAAFALCSPSRATILTGQYGSRNGVNGLGGKLHTPAHSIAHALKNSGYQTAFSGKWHLQNSPAELGFDWSLVFHSNGRWYGREVSLNGQKSTPRELIDAHCAKISARYLREERDPAKPFFLWHCTQLPHMDHRHTWPASAENKARFDPARIPLPPTWRGPGEHQPPHLATVRNRSQALKYGYDQAAKIREHIRDYAATIADLDQALAPLFAEIDRQKLRDNTLLIFLGDNGWMLGEHGLTSKVLAYQASTHIPFMISGPGVNPGKSDALVSNLDLAPTLLRAAGLPAAGHHQGLALQDLWHEDGHPWRRHFLYEATGGYGGVPPTGALITKEHRLIATWEKSPLAPAPFLELYDRLGDPHEQRNLASDPGRQKLIEKLYLPLREHAW
ncbi:MAG: sulfatase-like hydrolase/transferase [Verrucomicrobiales bacterium]